MKIVIVEDEVRIREGIRYLLEKMGGQYEVVAEAENGARGLEMILQWNPDVVITDVRMEVMDGLEMLTKLHAQNVRVKAIILSAYSEFAYAQQAVKLGVREYLLKPINISDFTRCIQSVEAQLEDEQNLGGEMSPETVVQALLSEKLLLTESMEKRLKERCHISNQTSIALLAAYIGNDYASSRECVRDMLMAALNEQAQGFVLEREQERLYLLVLYGPGASGRAALRLAQGLARDENLLNRCALGLTSFMGVKPLKENYARLVGYMDWNIALGDGKVIESDEAARMKLASHAYPLEADTALRSSICARASGAVDRQVQAFFDSFWKGDAAVVPPCKVKEHTVRLIWSILETATSIGLMEMQVTQRHAVAERIMLARSREELIRLTLGVCRAAVAAHAEEEYDNLTVKRAVSLIHENYQSGITLQEIAYRLGVTPEHLSALFHRCMQEGFSAYIRNLRVQRAKELLIGTHLRQYEIAEKLGYTDSKYFSKVFKESTGLLPADYRKMKK